MRPLFFILFLLTGSAQAAWTSNGSEKDRMTDTIYQGWVNRSTSGDVELRIDNQTYSNNETSTLLHLRSLTNRWRPFRTERIVLHGEEFLVGILYGRIRLDNEPPINIRFGFSSGNNNTFISFTKENVLTASDKELAVKIAKANKILIEVFSDRKSNNRYDTEIFEFFGGIR